MPEYIFEEQFPQSIDLMLYGQHDYVIRVQKYMERLRPDLQLLVVELGFGVDEIDASEFDLTALDTNLNGYDSSGIILVCLPVKWQEEAQAHLCEMGFRNLFIYDAVMDNRLKVEFFKSVYDDQGKQFNLLIEMPLQHEKRLYSLTVYMAKCVVDKPLSKDLLLPKEVLPIQVGAALTDKHIADLTDDTGDNISKRNRRYSEMTAFYWMWKNDKTADYLGLCHYRRLWVDLDIIVEKLQTADIDAVLPLPTLCEHSVYEDYLLKYIPTVWQPMLEVMKRRSPDYYVAAQEIFKGKIFYASNMCILRRKVLDDLCKWMFPIVMEVEEIVGDIEDPYYNRYAGFCTERLITLYFLYNKNHWNIAHAEKVFIG